MGEINLDTMSNEYFDVLKELGNIGAGNATTALSQMIQCKIDMAVPQVQLLEFKELGAAIMFLLEKKAAKHLVAKLMGMESEQEDLSEMELSALKEVGNIITGAYLNSLSSITNLTIFPSVPDLTVDMAGAILSVPAIEFAALGDRMLMIQTQFFDEMVLDGYFILIPDLDSYGKMLAALGINM